MLTRIEAKSKIELFIKNNNPVKTGIKLPIRVGKTFSVYKIPIEYLVPNVLNDRIAWKIREFEAENKRKLSFENQNDISYVYKLIEDEHPESNLNTLKDLAINGQQEHGVITNTGIIIDGNRRATLIKKLFDGDATTYNKSVEEFRFFDAIVLDEDIEETEIMALETSLQIGKDEKVAYNAINIYIKIDNLIKSGFSIKKIAGYMNRNESEIKQKVETFELMNLYLDVIDKQDHFTLLEGLEDHFINTKNIFKKLDNKSYEADWKYTETDVANFKEVTFDYIRAKFEGKKFRDVFLGKPHKTDGVFIKEDFWKDFYSNHTSIIENTDLINEEDWKSIVPQLLGNLKRTNTLLTNSIEDKNITSIIETVKIKISNLEEMLKKKSEINENDIENLHKIEKRIYSIRKEYE